MQLINSQRTAANVLTEKAFENGVRILQALGGSTNAVIHLIAIAGRCGLRLSLDLFDRLGDTTPLLVDLKPSGAGYMEDFHRAGGMPVVLQELKPLLHLDAPTIDGRTLGQVLDRAYQFPAWQTVIRPRASR